MFRKKVNLSDHDVGTPSIPTPGSVVVGTPGLTTSFLVNTPAPLTPNPITPMPATPGPPTFVPPGEEVERPVLPDEPPSSSAVPSSTNPDEDDEALYKQLSMQNMFDPKTASMSLDSSLTQWVMTPSTAAESIEGANGAAAATEGTSDMDSLQIKLGATKPVIHNVVATASLGCELDLKQIAMAARNAEYNPRRFSAVIMRVREPKSTALVFKSGRLVVTGTTSADQAHRAARKFGRIIKKIGYNDVIFKGFKVENLVSTFNVPFPIHLEQLYKHLPPPTHSQYEPEVFPGLICRVPDTSDSKKEKKGTLLIFVSGKCVMIGMKTKKDIEGAYAFILPFLNQYRKK